VRSGWPILNRNSGLGVLAVVWSKILAIHDAGHVCVWVETFDPTDDTRAENDAERVRGCEIFVLLIGKSCGHLGPDGRTSIQNWSLKLAKKRA
jgi:hypothetical protein